MDKFVKKVIKTIKKYDMIQPGDKIIVAVSGGPDSICLLDILNQIKGQLNFFLIIAHVNHGIRNKESDTEARFVRRKSSHMSLPFEQVKVSVPDIARERNCSVEQAGRTIRYHFFKELLKKHQAQKIALGHHADDQVETILMRIMRGCGLRGLRGIPARRNTFIRPLIECKRLEIRDYCHRRKIAYCLDSSNKEPQYLRNKIRHQLIPLLVEEYHPSVCYHLLQLRDIVIAELSFWEEIIEQYYLKTIKKEYSQGIILDSEQLSRWPIAVQRRVIRKALIQLRDYLAGIEFNHVESIRKLCLVNQGEKYLDLPGGIRIRKSYRNLEMGYARDIKKPTDEEKTKKWEYPLPVGKEKEYPQLSIRMNSKLYANTSSLLRKYLHNIKKDEAFLDYHRLKLPLKIRNRRPGDRFKPLNSQYFKKIKSYFIDQKIPFHERENIRLVVDSSECIVWIVGLQIDDRFKITKQTVKVLYIEEKKIEKSR